MLKFIKRLKEERDNAEQRAFTHFRKLNKIENIIKESDKNKELYYVTVMKIKRELAISQTNH